MVRVAQKELCKLGSESSDMYLLNHRFICLKIRWVLSEMNAYCIFTIGSSNEWSPKTHLPKHHSFISTNCSDLPPGPAQTFVQLLLCHPVIIQQLFEKPVLHLRFADHREPEFENFLDLQKIFVLS